jgi:nitronate monooxygenase
MSSSMSTDTWLPNLTIPVIAAPMTAVSTAELVIAACTAGVVGAFPTSNCTSGAELDEWLDRIAEARSAATSSSPIPPGPVATNLIVHKSNTRLDDDVRIIIEHEVPLVITSVGDPVPVIEPLHAGGCAVYVDVASLKHAHRAVEAGADGLVLLGAGAGGHTGWANPFAFVRAVRAFYDGPVVLAGGISDGHALWSAITLGCDLGYLGTKLIATHESGVSDDWRDGVVSATMDDIVLSTAPNGVAASILPTAGSAGHTVSGVSAVTSVAEVIRATTAEWRAAQTATSATLQVGPTHDR